MSDVLKAIQMACVTFMACTIVEAVMRGTLAVAHPWVTVGITVLGFLIVLTQVAWEERA